MRVVSFPTERKSSKFCSCACVSLRIFGRKKKNKKRNFVCGEAFRVVFAPFFLIKQIIIKRFSHTSLVLTNASQIIAAR